MIIIQSYVCSSDTFITTLSHEMMIEHFAGSKCSASYPNLDTNNHPTYWIAEPSAIREIAKFCKEHYHVMQKIKSEMIDLDNPLA